VKEPVDRAAATKRSKRRILGFASVGIAVGAVVGLVAALLVINGPKPDPVAASMPVALSHVKAPSGTAIGVVVTLGQGRAEGSEWGSAAQGAVVAQHRLALGGSDVALHVEDDHGSAEGGAAAVARLAGRGVSGIVIASSGDHLAATAAAASDAGIAAVLPYAPVPSDAKGRTGVWSLAPAVKDVVVAMNRALASYEHPLLLDTGTGVSDGLDVDDVLRVDGDDLDRLADEAAKRSGSDASAHGAYLGGDDRVVESALPQGTPDTRVDALVVDGHPRDMAKVVAALEARNVSVPVIVGPAAVSPVFTQALGEHGGAVSSALRTVGVPAEDSLALGQDAGARAMSAYLQALRQVADDGEATDLSGDAPFAEVAPWADVRSHDAVIALVTAAAKGGSPEPERVRAGLRGLSLSAAGGIAGAAQDFSATHVVSREVQVLHATAQPLGLRPHDPDRLTLGWFPAPASP
jgi:hypothetical protein